MSTREPSSTLQSTINTAKSIANYYISSSFRLRIISILMHQLSLMSSTLRASQFFISSTKGLLTRLVNSYKILAQSIPKMPLKLVRSIHIQALLTKLLSMPVKTLLAKNSTKMQMHQVLRSKSYQLRPTILLARLNAIMQLSAKLTLSLMPKFKGLLRKWPYK